MAHIYSQLIPHIIFSTQNRIPYLKPDLREATPIFGKSFESGASHSVHRKPGGVPSEDSFQQEYRAFLEMHRIEYDSRYLH